MVAGPRNDLGALGAVARVLVLRHVEPARAPLPLHNDGPAPRDDRGIHSWE